MAKKHHSFSKEYLDRVKQMLQQSLLVPAIGDNVLLTLPWYEGLGVIRDIHEAKYGTRYKIVYYSEEKNEDLAVWVFRSEFVFGAYTIYRKEENTHGHPQLYEIAAIRRRPVCASCRTNVYENTGQGTVCEYCQRETDEAFALDESFYLKASV